MKILSIQVVICYPFSPHISPIDAMIASDFCRQWVPATESVSGYTVEEACAQWRQKDKRGRIKRSL